MNVANVQLPSPVRVPVRLRMDGDDGEGRKRKSNNQRNQALEFITAINPEIYISSSRMELRVAAVA